ncbi:hypothetical protein DNTS_018598 [Danionella cerebrum]|uniref:Laminin G domain-containing protein n=1 Tax=Danionella cerebrum TaxID=2873325 RepID=A0A553Q9M6_9TELE|nr:hypothetical protein DNTS_018598 [Danionella translucida]
MSSCFQLQSVLVLLSAISSVGVGLEFPGVEGQWARYLRWDASTRSDLSLQFKTSVSNALLLYFDDGGYCDFLLLSIEQGKLKLHFSVDCAETTITSERAVNDSRWHLTTISRHNLRTVLALDGVSKVDEVRPQRQFMKIVSDLYLGGVPQDIRTSALTLPAVKEMPPFKGIITDLGYGNQVPTRLGSHKVRLEMEGLCTENPCENGGGCSMTDGEAFCDCSRTGYGGRYCNEGKKSSSPSLSFYPPLGAAERSTGKTLKQNINTIKDAEDVSGTALTADSAAAAIKATVETHTELSRDSAPVLIRDYSALLKSCNCCSVSIDCGHEYKDLAPAGTSSSKPDTHRLHQTQALDSSQQRMKIKKCSSMAVAGDQITGRSVFISSPGYSVKQTEVEQVTRESSTPSAGAQLSHFATAMMPSERLGTGCSARSIRDVLVIYTRTQRLRRSGDELHLVFIT